MLRCYNRFCIYSENFDCHNPDEPYIDDMGACASCIMIDINEESIKENKEKKRLKTKKPAAFRELYKKESLEESIAEMERYVVELKRALEKATE